MRMLFITVFRLLLKLNTQIVIHKFLNIFYQQKEGKLHEIMYFDNPMQIWHSFQVVFQNAFFGKVYNKGESITIWPWTIGNLIIFVLHVGVRNSPNLLLQLHWCIFRYS